MQSSSKCSSGPDSKSPRPKNDLALGASENCRGTHRRLLKIWWGD